MGCAASTENAGIDDGAENAPFDPASPYELHPDVALRPEPFGALAYHYGNRRLTFLRSRALLELVTALASYESVDESMSALGIEDATRPAMRGALATLASSGVVRRRAASGAA